MILNSPQQIFTALSNGQPVYYSEKGTEDWSPLSPKSQINFADLYSGFLQFKTEELPVFKLPIESAVYAAQAKYFVEFVHNLNGFEVYRVGKDKFSYYAVRVNSNRPSVRDYFANLDVFRISNTSGFLMNVDKGTLHLSIVSGLERARSIKRRAEYNQILENTGHFKSDEYKKWAKTHRAVH